MKIRAALRDPGWGPPCHFKSLLRLLGRCLVVLCLTGCNIFQPARTALYDGPRGTVMLEEVAERGATAAFRSPQGLDASHPIILEPAVLAGALQGMQIRKASSLGSLLDTAGPPEPIFSPEEAGFLAPILSTALTKATPSQYVIFHLRQTPLGLRTSEISGAAAGSSTPLPNLAQTEQTSGTLYVYGRSLHLTLTEYRHVPERPDAIQMANRRLADPTGLSGRTVSFVPESALRPDLYRRTVLPFSEDLPTLVIDYQRLPRMAESFPAASPPPPQPIAAPVAPHGLAAQEEGTGTSHAPATAGEIRTLKELVIKKDLELERLREELQQLKQEKARSQGTPPGTKSTKPSPSKTPPP